MKVTSTKKIIDETFDRLYDKMHNLTKGLLTDYPEFDQSLGGCGFENGSLTILGGRPRMGSTVFTLNILVNQIEKLKENEKIVYVSTDLSPQMVILKMLTIFHRIDINKMQNGDLISSEFNQLKLHEINKKLNKHLILVNENVDINKIKTLVKTETQKQSIIKLLVLDKIPNIDNNNTLNKFEDLGMFFKALNTIAKKQSFPILVISGTSINMDDKGDENPPTINNLNYSEEIIKLVDSVYFVHRQSFYETKTNRQLDDFELICAKSKNGSAGFSLFTFNTSNLKITPLTFSEL